MESACFLSAPPGLTKAIVQRPAALVPAAASRLDANQANVLHHESFDRPFVYRGSLRRPFDEEAATRRRNGVGRSRKQRRSCFQPLGHGPPIRAAFEKEQNHVANFQGSLAMPNLSPDTCSRGRVKSRRSRDCTPRRRVPRPRDNSALPFMADKAVADLHPGRSRRLHCNVRLRMLCSQLEAKFFAGCYTTRTRRREGTNRHLWS